MFQQRSPVLPASAALGLFQAEASPRHGHLHLGDAWNALRRRWLTVIALGLLGLAAAWIAVKIIPPRFTAIAQILIQPTDLRVFDNAVTQRSTQSDSSIAQVESQAQVISSTNVLQRVIRGQNLESDPEFGNAPPGLRARLSEWLSGPAPRGDRGGAALQNLEEKLSVKRSERSFVVDVSVRSLDPDKAARIANAVVESYLAEQAASRSEAARRATTSLAARLGELKDRVRLAEEKAAAFKARNNLVAAGGRLVSDQQISELTANLATARNRAADARSRYEQIQNVRAGADPGAIAEAVQSPAVTALRAQYAEIARSEAEIGAKLGPLHPQVAEVQSQLRRARQLIDEEVGRLRTAARNDYERARASEAALARNLETLKRGAGTTEEALVRLRELEREVEASRAVYQAYLTRARETSEQESLDTNNARVISQAQPPLERSSPPRTMLLLAAGLLAGLGLGTGVAVLRGLTDRRVLSPTRLADLTARPVLAVITRPAGGSRWRLWRGRRAAERALARGARQLWGALLAGPSAGPQRAIVLVGEEPGAAPAAIGRALADAAAESGAKALLIDLTGAFGAPNHPGGPIGWGDLVSGRVTLEAFALVDRTSGAARLPPRALATLAPAGLDPTRLRTILDGAALYDTVVVALRPGTDPHVSHLAGWASDVVLLAGTESRLDDVEAVLASLASAGPKLRGSVLIRHGARS